MIKKICIFLFLIFLSCEKKETKCVLYYFEGDTFSTLIPLECEEIFDFPGLRQIEIDDNKLIENISNIRKFVRKEETYNPDVRYKVIFNNDTICFGYTSNFILNSNYKGEIDFLEDIRTYINNNEKKSSPVTSPLYKPYLKKE
jgi:hypothetical protein